MNPLEILLRPMNNRLFKRLLEFEFWQDVTVILVLSEIYRLDSLGESEFNEGHETIWELLDEKYDMNGSCPCKLYSYVSKDLRDEYDTIHCLIRSILDTYFKDFA